MTYRYFQEQRNENHLMTMIPGVSGNQYQGGQDGTHPLDYLQKVNMGPGELGALNSPPAGPYATSLDVSVDDTEQQMSLSDMKYVPHLAIGTMALFYLFA
jgi:hypothetical protein